MTERRQTRRFLVALATAGLLALAGASPTAAERPYVAERDVDYDLGTPPRSPSTADMNHLDLYRQPGSRSRSRPRPVVVWVHAGGWRRGDKRIGIRRKAAMFTRAGYLFASVNYRLSAAPFDRRHPDPHRVMFPAHPRDVGEAIGWLHRNVADYGGDRRRIVLIGHSAGAHLASLVATDPRYVRRYGVPFRRLAGFVSLDPPAFDIAAAADPASPGYIDDARTKLWNAFGTPEEDAATGFWGAASPIRFAGPNDPRALLITQAGNEQRLTDHAAMARALGRSPDRIVRPLPLDHREISRVLGRRGDRSGETALVRSFVRRAVADAKRRRR